MSAFLYIAILVFFLMWTRSSSKKKKEKEKARQDSLRPGMYIMVRDGLYGTVVDASDSDTAVVNFSIDGDDAGCMTVEKSAISSIVEDAASRAYVPEVTGDEELLLTGGGDAEEGSGSDLDASADKDCAGGSSGDSDSACGETDREIPEAEGVPDIGKAPETGKTMDFEGTPEADGIQYATETGNSEEEK